MKRDKYKEPFAKAVAEAFRTLYPDVLQSDPDAAIFDPEAVYQALETPKDPRMGRFAMPVFRYSRLLKAKPPEIASKVAEQTDRLLSSNGAPALMRCKAAGGYLNAQVDPAELTRETISSVLNQGENYGESEIGKGKTILVEYSSPNIAKPFGVGHLRTTIIGNSLRRVFKKLGYDVVGINYPGDWGTQFGKMIVAFRKWGGEETLQGDAVKNLLALYVRYHEEAERDPSLDDEARAAFRKLEEGDPDALKLWETLKEISFAEFKRVYDALGVEFDLTIGESFFNDKMDAVIERLEKDGLTKVSQGALIVELDEPNLPPALLRKKDGATLYITRDLAGMIYRWETYHFEESLYVVGSAQADHFRQCLAVIRKMEEAEKIPPHERMADRVKHIDFGWVRFDGKSMSTRRGNIILLEDVIREAVERVSVRVREKNPDLPDADRVAHMVGVGAIIFSQLSVRRQKDVSFVWEEVLNFEGETGPYLQYTHARLCSLLRNANREVTPEIDHQHLLREQEQRVIEVLADFPQAVADAARLYDPYFIASYLLRLTAAFNRVYQRKDESGRIDKIISDNRELTAARLALVKSVQVVLKEGLHLLGLEAPEKM
ncbi:MAG: arginine--tRNA ligase [Candidatus Zixiibacteriota bacterium]|nr:MAG: arginine--tRNA ligase [candidate division Zixibacteria bacterium]